VRYRPPSGALPHSWAAQEGRQFRCTLCLFAVGSTTSQRARRACPGYSQLLRDLTSNQLGHALYEFEGKALFVLACSACGGWASSQAYKLQRECTRIPTQSGTKDWNKLAKGRHPTSGEKVAEGRPFLYRFCGAGCRRHFEHQ